MSKSEGPNILCAPTHFIVEACPPDSLFLRPCPLYTARNQLLYTVRTELLVTCLVRSSTQAIRMRSAVAGQSNGNGPSKPTSLRAAAMASLIAKKTVVAKPNGGSPIACQHTKHDHCLDTACFIKFVKVNDERLQILVQTQPYFTSDSCLMLDYMCAL